jgi:hypothetical protein
VPILERVQVELPTEIAHVEEQSSGRWLSANGERTAKRGVRLLAKRLLLEPNGRRTLPIIVRKVGGEGEELPNIKAWAALPDKPQPSLKDTVKNTFKVSGRSSDWKSSRDSSYHRFPSIRRHFLADVTRCNVEKRAYVILSVSKESKFLQGDSDTNISAASRRRSALDQRAFQSCH